MGVVTGVETDVAGTRADVDADAGVGVTGTITPTRAEDVWGSWDATSCPIIWDRGMSRGMKYTVHEEEVAIPACESV